MNSNIIETSTCFCKKCSHKIINTDFPLFTYNRNSLNNMEYREFEKDVKSYECPYCHTTGKIVPIDPEIVDTIIIFHKKGWVTKSSCGGYIANKRKEFFTTFYVTFYLPTKWNSVDWFIRMVKPDDCLTCTLFYDKDISSNGSYTLRNQNLLCKIELDSSMIKRSKEPTSDELQFVYDLNKKAREVFTRFVLLLPDLTLNIPMFTKEGQINPDAV